LPLFLFFLVRQDAELSFSEEKKPVPSRLMR